MSRNGPLAGRRIAFEGFFDLETRFRVMVRLHARCCQHTDEHRERSTDGSRSSPRRRLWRGRGRHGSRRLVRHGRVNRPWTRMAPELPNQAQQTQQHGRHQKPLETLYADTGIRVVHPSRTTGFHGVLDQFANRGLVRQRRCRLVATFSARRKVLQGRRREAGDDRVLLFVQ